MVAQPTASTRNLPTGRILATRLKLTGRQAETLFWVAQGKSNREIAVILGTSTHTIHRHVEAILERLGVESRAAAMLVALEALGWLKWPTGTGVTPW